MRIPSFQLNFYMKNHLCFYFYLHNLRDAARCSVAYFMPINMHILTFIHYRKLKSICHVSLLYAYAPLTIFLNSKYRMSSKLLLILFLDKLTSNKKYFKQ